MQKQGITHLSRELTASLDKLDYISQTLQELANMVCARAGKRLPELMPETHLELTEVAARPLAEQLSELGQAFEQAKMHMRKAG